MSWTIVGAASIDDCSAGPGACGVNCGVTCQPNEYHVSYPYFTECGSIICEANTGQPKATETCGEDITLHCGCSNVTAIASIQDCGPPGDQPATSGYCMPESMYRIGCVNTALFSALCAGCIPIDYGNIGVRFSG